MGRKSLGKTFLSFPEIHALIRKKGWWGLDRLSLFQRDLEEERSLKVKAILDAYNPVEKELLERELALIDAQMIWVNETITKENSARIWIGCLRSTSRSTLLKT